MGKRPALLWGLVAAALLLLAGCRQQRSYRAQRFDVDIVVHEDGSALITETVSFNFQGGPFTHVFREIPLERTDGIEAVSVSEGDRTYTLGSGPHQYQVQSSGDDLRVTWQFPPTENTQRTFALSYRVAGLIRQEDGQDALRWAAIPPEHDYGMTRATVRVQLPRHVGPITGVRVLDGRAEIGRQGREVTF